MASPLESNSFKPDKGKEVTTSHQLLSVFASEDRQVSVTGGRNATVLSVRLDPNQTEDKLSQKKRKLCLWNLLAEF